MEVRRDMFSGWHVKGVKNYLLIQQALVCHQPVTTLSSENKKCQTGILKVALCNNSFLK
jgi:hypothetical protein